ncbi:MAG: hypothetical protein CVU89_04835 [Firmicutes bacterium HGW-Firmicutes-14]|jgi:GTPase SAR1 family protein|nr:MAG: hypothetical protein CVU89_04835 [Firmicutes bacterium HGW-Firmicutes-14]
MTLTGGWITKNILITVKAYPTPSQTYGEAVCTAGITEDGKWIRLYPVQFRDLPFHLRFKKYQWIKGRIRKSSDYRPESYKVDHDSLKPLQVLDTKDKWQKRKEIVLPLLVDSLEKLESSRAEINTSLGIIKPKKIVDFFWEQVEDEWSQEQKGALSNIQMSLFDIRKTQEYSKLGLEKIPYKFYYHFYCDDKECKGHKLQILDWELGEAYRSWNYPKDTLLQKIKEKYFEEFTTKKEVYLYLGTLFELHRFGTFSIIGLFYPPK